MCWLQQSAQLWSCPTFLLVPLMIVAGVECFAGHRAWRFLLGVNGAALGFVAGATVIVLCGASMLLLLLGAVVGAIAGAALFISVEPLGSFVFGFGSAASLAIVFAHIGGAPSYCVTPLAALAGLAGAVGATAACRPCRIGIAAIAGAQQLASAWRAYHLPADSLPSMDQITSSELAAFLTLAGIGLLIQFATSGQIRLGRFSRRHDLTDARSPSASALD